MDMEINRRTSRPKKKRNAALLAAHQTHPEWNQTRLGQEFGITKQRVSRLLKKMREQNG